MNKQMLTIMKHGGGGNLATNPCKIKEKIKNQVL